MSVAVGRLEHLDLLSGLRGLVQSCELHVANTQCECFVLVVVGHWELAAGQRHVHYCETHVLRGVALGPAGSLQLL